MNPPDIFDYPFRLTFRDYLEDWFNWKKATYGAGPGNYYSHRLFVRRVGLRGPSALHNVMRGRQKLTPALAEVFLRELALTETGANLFRALVAHDQLAERVAQHQKMLSKKRLGRRRRATLEAVLAGALRGHAVARDHLRDQMLFKLGRELDERERALLMSWTYRTIRELATCRDFRADASWIMAMLRFPTEAAEVAEALKGINWTSPPIDQVLIASVDELENQTTDRYYRQMQLRMLEATQTLLGGEDVLASSVLRGLTLALPEAAMPRINQLVQEFLRGVFELHEAGLGHSDRVFQVNVHVFPLTHLIEASAESPIHREVQMTTVGVTIRVPDTALKDAESLMEPMRRAGAIREQVTRDAILRAAVDRGLTTLERSGLDYARRIPLPDGHGEVRGIRIWEHSRRRAKELIPKLGQTPIVYLIGAPVTLGEVLRAALLFGLHQLREECGSQASIVGRST